MALISRPFFSVVNFLSPAVRAVMLVGHRLTIIRDGWIVIRPTQWVPVWVGIVTLVVFVTVTGFTFRALYIVNS